MSAACTFESFVVCAASNAAFRAAFTVAEHPDSRPLLLYGRVGSGKSHLLQAIERRMRSSVIRSSAIDLAESLCRALRRHETQAFRESLAATDALLIDDIHDLRNLPVTQQEIIRTLKELADRGVQVVVTSDKPLHDFDRVFKIGYPDERARREIARRVASNAGLTLRDSVIRAVAKRAQGSPRRIQSAIARIAAEVLPRYAPIRSESPSSRTDPAF